MRIARSDRDTVANNASTSACALSKSRIGMERKLFSNLRFLQDEWTLVFMNTLES